MARRRANRTPLPGPDSGRRKALLLDLADIFTSFAVGSYLAGHDDPWWHLLPFLALTVFLLALPALTLLVFGERAQHFLPKARQWMNDNSWVVNEIVLGLFIALTISDIAG